MGGERTGRAVASQNEDAGPVGSKMLDEGVQDALQDRRGLPLLEKLTPDLIKGEEPS
jgi:hypothetical protein